MCLDLCLHFPAIATFSAWCYVPVPASDEIREVKPTNGPKIFAASSCESVEPRNDLIGTVPKEAYRGARGGRGIVKGGG